MANKALFKSLLGRLTPKTDAVNEELAPAYALSPRHALAQVAATGCLNSTFYASAETHLEKVLGFCAEVEPEFIARTALYCRKDAWMKDAPALLCAVLSVRSPELLARIFPRVIDNGKMLRNFVQLMRSGAVGRKSLGSAPKRLVRQWLEARDESAVFRASVGQSPSLADVIKMVHPRPASAKREALYGYLIGKTIDTDQLPASVQAYESYKKDKLGPVPNVPFEMLTALDLGTAEWTEIARNANWQMTRMNLNTFARHGVFGQKGMPEMIAARLKDPRAIAEAKVFPFQLLSAYRSAGDEVPAVVAEALQDAMERAIANVPSIDGALFVCPDVSGSMSSPVTGFRKGSTSKVRCVDAAALMAAALLRTNPDAEILPFAQGVVKVALNPRDTVMTNAGRLAAVMGGGTNCSAPLARLNEKGAKGNLVILISDNESWMDAGGRGTATMREWNAYKARNRNARLVCIDIQPNATTQAVEREDILNVGGFSDEVFKVVAAFADGTLSAAHWVGRIEAMEL